MGKKCLAKTCISHFGQAVPCSSRSLAKDLRIKFKLEPGSTNMLVTFDLPPGASTGAETTSKMAPVVPALIYDPGGSPVKMSGRGSNG